MTDTIIAISYNHENAPVDFRDRITLNDSESLQFIKAALHESDPIKELTTLSTCNRTEVYAVLPDPTDFYPWVAKQFRDLKKVDIDRETHNPTILQHREAVRHLLGVAGGLKSMMLGENQILTQVKSSYELLLSTSYQTPILNRLFKDAIRAGKSIRTRTALCQGAVSISLASVELARKIFSNFTKRTVLIVGAGESAELVLMHFKKLGVNEFIIANRGVKRREKLASKYGARPLSLNGIDEALKEADIVVTATKSSSYLITKEMTIAALKSRDYRTLLVVDISTPRNVAPDTASLREVFLYNIDDLKQIMTENLENRKKEIPDAEAIVTEITNEFFDWFKSLEVVPTISKLNNYFNHVRSQELKKYIHKASEKEYEQLEELSNSIVRKLLHYPITELREQNHKGNLNVAKINALWELFRLHELKEFSK